MPVAVVRNDQPNGDAHCERERRWRPYINGWRIIIVNRVGIGRNINDLRVGRLDLHNYVGHIDDLLFDGLFDDRVGDDDDLLRCRFQHSRGIRFGAQHLDRIHQLFLLIEEGLAQVHRPREVIVHFLDQFRELRHGLHVFVPRLLVQLRNIIGVLDEPCRLHNLQGIHRRRQDDGDQRVGMQGNGRGELFQLRGAELGRCGRGRHGRDRRGVCLCIRGR